MKNIFLLNVLFFVLTNFGYSQNIQYKYDNANRLIQAIYPNQMAITYTYDQDGNRKTLTTGIATQVIVTNPTDSALLQSGEIMLYPNPSTGTFKGKFYVSEAQEVTIQIFNLIGQLIATYSATLAVGFQEFSITINPAPQTGTYVVNVKGASLNKSAKVVIVH